MQPLNGVGRPDGFLSSAKLRKEINPGDGRKINHRPVTSLMGLALPRSLQRLDRPLDPRPPALAIAIATIQHPGQAVCFNPCLGAMLAD
jgi:hypothetical protein